MSFAAIDDVSDALARASVPRRLLVTVKVGGDDGRGTYRHVGFLTCLDAGFEFVYTSGAEGVLPLLGFPDLTARYLSDEMFPLFAERIMSARRPDRAGYLHALDLAEDSEPWEVLVRSGGRRAGDTIEVLPEPTVADDGTTQCTFLVHGVRHCGNDASQAIRDLREGDLLRLEPEPDNPVNVRAVLVTNDAEVRLGYVPDPLVDYMHRVVGQGDYSLTVVRANGPEVGSHLRLLVRLDGSLPRGYRPFEN